MDRECTGANVSFSRQNSEIRISWQARETVQQSENKTSFYAIKKFIYSGTSIEQSNCGTGQICSSNRGFVISRLCSIHFTTVTLAGTEKIVRQIEDFVKSGFR